MRNFKKFLTDNSKSLNTFFFSNPYIQVNDRKIKAEEKMQSMKNRLNLLWNRLETPDQTREEFLADKVSLTQDTFTAVSNKFHYLNTHLIIPPPTFTEKKYTFLSRAQYSGQMGVIFMSVQKNK